MRTQENHELGCTFFDYVDDKEALLHEDEVAQSLDQLGCPFSDPSFSDSPESLYRTPQQPPVGSIPPPLVVWARISRQEIRQCHTPVTFPVDGGILSAVQQGALEDSWLVSALEILLPFDAVLRNVIVSDRHRNKGIYTVKLFKEGSWRYLHLDDRLPCWPLRDYYYSSCKDPNQIWAALIEKAFAKLHGCYENLERGSIEQGLRSLSGTPVLRTPLGGFPLSVSPSSQAGREAVSDNRGQELLENLWTRLESWQKRGCAMGCFRSVEHDRARVCEATAKSCSSTAMGSSRAAERVRAGLIAGQGYGIESVRKVSASATATRDAVSFNLVKLGCPGGMGYWRGAWSAESELWSRYPSIDAELRPKTEEPGPSYTGNSSSPDSFWMSIADFAAEFSQVFTCASYPVTLESKGVSRKSYRGRWVPGDSLTGSGGLCTNPSFLQNPFYPITVTHSSTTLTVTLSVGDRRWQLDPSKSCPAIGYYILRLTGAKPRLTRFHRKKIVSRSAVFMAACQSAGEHTLNPGRYGVVPVTTNPLRVAEGFLLDLIADKEIEWEQLDENFDQEVDLKVSVYVSKVWVESGESNNDSKDIPYTLSRR